MTRAIFMTHRWQMESIGGADSPPDPGAPQGDVVPSVRVGRSVRRCRRVHPRCLFASLFVAMLTLIGGALFVDLPSALAAWPSAPMIAAAPSSTVPGHPDFRPESGQKWTHCDARWVLLGASLFALVAAVLSWRAVMVARDNRRLLAALHAHQQAESRLRLSEEHYRTLLEGIPQKVFHKDTHSIYLSCNRAFAVDLGIPPRTIAGKSDYDFFPPVLADKYRADDQVVICSGKPIEVEESYLHQGREYTVNTIKAPVRDDQGQIRGVLGIFWDITERKRHEQALQSLTESLELKVRERTRELQLANQELDSFAYSVSHDLRAPLRAIDGMSAILQEDYGDRFDAAGVRYLMSMHQATREMRDRIDGLLGLSRAAQAALRRERVDLSILAQSIVQVLRQAAPERSGVVDIESGLEVEGDPHLLRILLENILGNAWKYTGRHPRPHILFGQRRQEGATIFFVTDNGAGFDMAYSQSLFQPFRRLHGQAEFPGTGIGLATAQRIVRRHGGRIWAEGRVGEGATFHFTLSEVVKG
ncbi:MAG: PAS domain-containing protein [Magnetococcales bacterium]|nr:PAS domain-containing protein [Magnetococcales bacterium]